jgi:transcriptional regulator NrdR family protein
MNCSSCNSETKVITTRRNHQGLRRRRECLKCTHRFTTVEVNLDKWETKPLSDDKRNKQILAKAEALVSQHIRIGILFENVETDSDLDDIPEALMEEYRQAEDDFLLLAHATDAQFFSLTYSGTQYLIRCCDQFEEIQIDQLIQLTEK